MISALSWPVTPRFAPRSPRLIGVVVERRVSKPASPRAPVLYQISGTAASCYNATHQIVVTNGAFTEPARRWAHDPRHRVHLIDHDRLGE